MQEFSVAFGRVSRATFSANPELKSHITDLLSRAYYNLHGLPLGAADPAWSGAITMAAVQLCMDSRVAALSSRDLVALFENVIRVSEEHLAEARRHAAMAINVFYLKETALDAATIESEKNEIVNSASTVVGLHLAHNERLKKNISEPAA